jgi:hypothetical protein
MNGKPLWMDYLPEARAVIEAIREPSEGMIEYEHEHGGHGDTRLIWCTMIDALLAE